MTKQKCKPMSKSWKLHCLIEQFCNTRIIKLIVGEKTNNIVIIVTWTHIYPQRAVKFN